MVKYKINSMTKLNELLIKSEDNNLKITQIPLVKCIVTRYNNYFTDYQLFVTCDYSSFDKSALSVTVIEIFQNAKNYSI